LVVSALSALALGGALYQAWIACALRLVPTVPASSMGAMLDALAENGNLLGARLDGPIPDNAPGWTCETWGNSTGWHCSARVELAGVAWEAYAMDDDDHPKRVRALKLGREGWAPPLLAGRVYGRVVDGFEGFLVEHGYRVTDRSLHSRCYIRDQRPLAVDMASLDPGRSWLVIMVWAGDPCHVSDNPPLSRRSAPRNQRNPAFAGHGCGRIM
jgi:hypothetical protein